jgi:hypothetical protein
MSTKKVPLSFIMLLAMADQGARGIGFNNFEEVEAALGPTMGGPDERLEEPVRQDAGRAEPEVPVPGRSSGEVWIA